MQKLRRKSSNRKAKVNNDKTESSSNDEAGNSIYTRVKTLSCALTSAASSTIASLSKK